MRSQKQFSMSAVPRCIRDAPSQFKIKMQSGDGSVDLIMMDDIGETWEGEGVTSRGVQSFLADNRDRPINLKVNSLGGSFYEGLSIYNSLLEHPKPITATITGIAFSAATLPVMAADRVIMPEASDFGIHRAWTVTAGNATELEDAAEWLKSVDDHAANLYASKTGKSLKQINDWMDGKSDGTKFSATEALEAGFADEVVGAKPAEPDATAQKARVAARIQQNRIKTRLGLA